MRRLFAALVAPLVLPSTSHAQVPAPQMQEGRWAASSVRLRDGRLLVAGGYSFAAKNTTASADLFDPVTGSFSSAAPMLLDRNFATATLLLPSQKVLVAGGFSERGGGTRNNAEVYDPVLDRWTFTKTPMNDSRELFTATRLADGQVLLAGGLSLKKRGTLATGEIYDPAADVFTPASRTLKQDRFGHAAALLPDGRVLLVGGQSWKIGQPSSTLSSGEIYDPKTGHFTETASPMHFARDRCTATALKDGRVLIAGGTNKGNPPLPAEIFDPQTGQFALAAPLREGRMAHDACLLPDGSVIVAGGWSDSRKATTASVEVYDPLKNTWTKLADLPFNAHDLSLFWLPLSGRISSTGHILAVGGKSTPGDEAKATSVSAGAWIETGAAH